jgi:hypothetical protein
MGYDIETLKKVLPYCKPSIRMLELGNQELYTSMNTWSAFAKAYGFTPTNMIMKPFFEHMGIKYTSVDYNGKDGALNYDLREDISNKFPTKFDLITNMGFSEHVGETNRSEELLRCQYSVFKNIHDVADVGAIMHHCVPLKDYWPGHGVCDYTLDFFTNLAKACGYTVVVKPYIEDYHPELLASVFLKKIAATPFISYDAFSKCDGLRILK